MAVSLCSIKLNKEFKHAYYQGKFKAHPMLVSYLVKNRVRQRRVGITVSKKIGCAVLRNRARRIIRRAFWELCREEDQAAMFTDCDVVFVARAAIVGKKTQEVKAVMKKQLSLLIRLG